VQAPTAWGCVSGNQHQKQVLAQTLRDLVNYSPEFKKSLDPGATAVPVGTACAREGNRGLGRLLLMPDVLASSMCV
jgi:hypothetical protein